MKLLIKKITGGFALVLCLLFFAAFMSTAVEAQNAEADKDISKALEQLQKAKTATGDTAETKTALIEVKSFLNQAGDKSSGTGKYAQLSDIYAQIEQAEGRLEDGNIEDAERIIDSVIGTVESLFGGQASADPTAEEFRIESDCEDLDNCGVIDSLIDIVNILSAAVGVVIVIMIAVGGVQYTMSRDNPQAVAAARQRIFNAILALVVFMGMVAFLQWLVPGGIFSG